MSFQAYLNNIKTKTGKTPDDFKKLAEKKSILNKNTKAGDLVKWLKEEFDLGHGHSMAIWKSFQDNGWVGAMGKETMGKIAIGKKAISKEAISKKASAKKTKGNGKELVDRYIAGFSKEMQVLLEKMRSIISRAAPEAEETIGYGIPTFKLNGNLVHFGGYKNHIGFYPAPSAIKAFEKELSVYEGAKGSVQFPADKPLPVALISKIIQYRVKENEAKAPKTKKAK